MGVGIGVGASAGRVLGSGVLGERASKEKIGKAAPRDRSRFCLVR
jgi:hypothetical protein